MRYVVIENAMLYGLNDLHILLRCQGMGLFAHTPFFFLPWSPLQMKAEDF